MFSKEVTVPSAFEITIEENELTVTDQLRRITLRSHYDPLICRVIPIEGAVRFEAMRDRRIFESKTKTFASLFANNIQGLITPFERRLQIFFRHFPMKVEVRGSQVYIMKFLGEVAPRIATILDQVQVEVLESEHLIRVTGPSLPAVSQTAANIEQTCKIRHLDRRVFQDGIYLINESK